MRRVTNVDIPGHRQLFASKAYFNSSSQTICSTNFTCIRFSGLKRATYCGVHGAKSLIAHERKIVC